MHSYRFADTEVRSVAVSWIEKSSDDELADYLPQLVQVELLAACKCSFDRWLRSTLSELFHLSSQTCFYCFSSQALKFECHLKNALIVFLLSRALGNINIAHYLYW